MAKIADELCEICGRDYSAYCSYYSNHNWIDGRRHKIICHICYDVPIVHEVEDDIWYVKPFDPNRLQTVKEMVQGGWDKKDAEIAIKAVKKAIKKGKLRSK